MRGGLFSKVVVVVWGLALPRGSERGGKMGSGVFIITARMTIGRGR